MTTRTASARYEGLGQTGKGYVSTQSGVLSDQPYDFNTRFGETPGTNPEELAAAAHAACFTMAFSFACDTAGFATTAVDTQAGVRLVMKDGGFLIDRINLRLEATVPGIEEAAFQKIAAAAKQSCPLSKALASVPEITLTAVLRR
jgi:osmotically inducible protein OsmC